MGTNVSRTLLQANSTNFVAAFRHAHRVSANFALGMRAVGSSVTKSLAPIMLTLAPLIGGAAFASGIKSILDLGGSLNDVSARTGDSVKNLVILRQQLEDNGVAADDLGTIVNKMQDSLGQTNGQNAIKTLGLDIRAIQSLSPSAQFISIGRAIAQIQEPTRRTQLAMDLFGKAGGKLLTVFSDPAFGTGGGNLAKQAIMLERNAALFDSVSDRLGRIGIVMRGFFLGAAAQIAPALEGALAKLESVDLIGIGQKFGQGMITAGNVIMGIAKSAQPAFEGIGLSLQASVLHIRNAIDNIAAGVSDPQFWSGMLNGFIAVTQEMAAALLDAFAGPLSTLEEWMNKAFRVLYGSKYDQAAKLDERAAKLQKDMEEQQKTAQVLSEKGDINGAHEASQDAALSGRRRLAVLEERAKIDVPIPVSGVSNFKENAAYLRDKASQNRAAAAVKLQPYSGDFHGAGAKDAQAQAKFSQAMAEWQSGSSTFAASGQQPAVPAVAAQAAKPANNSPARVSTFQRWSAWSNSNPLGMSKGIGSKGGLDHVQQGVSFVRRRGESIGDFRERKKAAKESEKKLSKEEADAKAKMDQAKSQSLEDNTAETAVNTKEMLEIWRGRE